jgi:hypothetical protein
MTELPPSELIPEQGQVVTTTQTQVTANTSPSTKYIETTRALLVGMALTGTIALAWKYETALTPALVVLGGAVGGYFGVSQGSGKST